MKHTIQSDERKVSDTPTVTIRVRCPMCHHTLIPYLNDDGNQLRNPRTQQVYLECEECGYNTLPI